MLSIQPDQEKHPFNKEAVYPQLIRRVNLQLEKLDVRA